jgi:SAM-dependent methyltransferase
MRILVGLDGADAFDNPSGAEVFPEAGDRGYGAVFDFGCGCGRVARQLIQQGPPPQRYLGIDLHAGMVEWCSQHLSPRADRFEFVHHDVFNVGLNPGPAKPDFLPLPAKDRSFDLVVASSVFTHVVEPVALRYLSECARILEPDGMMVTTWFLFDKRFFPMMHEQQNALYINPDDPTNAVIFDRAWLYAALDAVGLVIGSAEPPGFRGHQWTLRLQPAASCRAPVVELPADTAPMGSVVPMTSTVAPALVGQPRWRMAEDARVTLDEYVASLEIARDCAEAYARTLEIARERAEAYARSLENARRQSNW